MNTKLVTFLDSILGNHTEYNGKELYYVCPMCNRFDGAKKLAINMDEHATNSQGHSIYMSFHCWRNVEHKGRNLFQLLNKIKCNESKKLELKSILNIKHNIDDFYNIESKYFINNKTTNTSVIRLPNEFISLKDYNNSPHYKNAYKYITESRGLTKSDIIRYDIGYCESGAYSGYIIIPSYGSDMNLNYFVARSYYNSKYKYKNPNISKNIVFNELFINPNDDLILVEGVFDAMAIKRNVVPILGKYISNALKMYILKNKIRNLYIALDSDAIMDSINIIEDFLKNNINIYFVQFDKKDPGELGFKDSWKCINRSMLVDFKNLVELKIKFGS